MAKRERGSKPPYGGFFVARAQILDGQGVARVVRRMAHEIIERNEGLGDVILVGLQTGGVPFAEAIASDLAHIEKAIVPVGKLDVANYRDDSRLRPVSSEAPTEIDFDVTHKVVVLVDDVLFTGRTVRSAMDALMDLGRPKAIQLASMIDRGHRELPIRADFIGKNVPTKRSEAIEATLDGVEIGEMSK